jgi:peptidylprolyl isomerase domain and WD repeat-containing protein 1
MADSGSSSKKRQRDGNDAEDDVGPLPSTESKQAKLKRRNVAFHSLYLQQLPNQDRYEKSYMHRVPLTHIEVTKTDFIITASSEGQVKFWKKEPTGIRFYKQLRAHMGMSQSYHPEALFTRIDYLWLEVNFCFRPSLTLFTVKNPFPALL